MSGIVHHSEDGRRIIVRVPLRARRRGSGKLKIVSDAPQANSAKSKIDNTILRALGRAYRWKRLLETGEFTSISHLAAAEKINHSYVRRLLRLPLLSPEITEMILDSRLPRNVQLEDLLRPLGTQWAEQLDQLI